MVDQMLGCAVKYYGSLEMTRGGLFPTNSSMSESIERIVIIS